MEASNYLKAVRDQYEAFPYPPRNPADEKVRLENSWHDFLELINFYCFKGRNNFSQECRVLVAGGGTGDQTIFLAEQLRYNRRAEVVHLDISDKCNEIAKRRAEVRKLANITWVRGSVLDLPSLKLGPFDYINCVGVLHHLEDPKAGPYIRDKRILAKSATLPRRHRQALAELLAVHMIVHNFYVARQADTVASLDDLRNVPFYFLDPPLNVLESIERSSGQSVKVKSTLYAAPVEFVPGPYTRDIFKYLDGERSLKELFEQIRRDHGKTEQQLPNDQLLNEFRPIYQQFNDLGWMLLRHRSVGKFRSLAEMQMPV